MADLERLRRLAMSGDLSAAEQWMSRARRRADDDWLEAVLEAWAELEAETLIELLRGLIAHAQALDEEAALWRLLELWREREDDLEVLRPLIERASEDDSVGGLRALLCTWGLLGGPLEFHQGGHPHDLEQLLDKIGLDPISLAQPVPCELVWAPERARLFACDCAARTLAPFEARYPDDDRPHKAIETARHFARGTVSKHALEDADRDATDASTLMGYSGSPWASAWVAHGEKVRCATVLSNAASSVEDRDAERRWQGQRLLRFLFGDPALEDG